MALHLTPPRFPDPSSLIEKFTTAELTGASRLTSALVRPSRRRAKAAENVRRPGVHHAVVLLVTIDPGSFARFSDGANDDRVAGRPDGPAESVTGSTPGRPPSPQKIEV